MNESHIVTRTYDLQLNGGKDCAPAFDCSCSAATEK